MYPEQIIEYFEGQGFIQTDPEQYKQLGLIPSFLFERDSDLKAVIIRDNIDNLRDSIIQRFADSKRIPTKTLEIYFAFPEKPGISILRSCKSFSVGILYVDKKNDIEIFAESKQLKGGRKRSTLPATYFFISSRQELEERIECRNRINEQKDSLQIPIFPKLVEDEQQYDDDIENIWPIICDCMDACEYVVIIVSGEYREIIEAEIDRTLELYDRDKILFYVKNDKQTKEEWNNVLLKATKAGIKYIEYFDLKELSLKFNRRLTQVILHLHDIHEVPFK